MCSPARCRSCGKTTWSGCGQHVAQVMARVPAARRCDCPEDERPRRLTLRELFGRSR